MPAFLVEPYFSRGLQYSYDFSAADAYKNKRKTQMGTEDAATQNLEQPKIHAKNSFLPPSSPGASPFDLPPAQ